MGLFSEATIRADTEDAQLLIYLFTCITLKTSMIGIVSPFVKHYGTQITLVDEAWCVYWKHEVYFQRQKLQK